MARPRISAFVVCCNEELVIERCLRSVAWCDEIIVVDSGSTDRTLEIARSFGAKIYHREWTGYVDQKAYGLTLCDGPWVLNLDADEEVSDGLRSEMIEVLSSDEEQRFDGFHINRVVYYLGRWWRHGGWYPEYRLRLCRKSATTWGGSDPHEKATVSGATRKLEGELYHYTYRDITDQIARLNSHSTAAARSQFEAGEHASLSAILLRPTFRFVKFYLLKRGFLDGVPGLVVAILEAYYVFLKYVKLWELRRVHRGR